MIANLTKNHASQVASLHIQGISTGFISSLGQDFVTVLYQVIAENEKILGFVAFSSNLSKLYKFVIIKKGCKFFFVLAKKMLSLQVIHKILHNLFYPSKMKKMSLPDAELLSIVVAPEGQGKGVAKQLVDAGFDECRRRGIDKLKVLVAADNEAANKLYQKSGFELKTQIDSHGIKSNIYVRDLTKV